VFILQNGEANTADGDVRTLVGAYGGWLFEQFGLRPSRSMTTASVIVPHVRGAQSDGTDTLVNIEQLEFAGAAACASGFHPHLKDAWETDSCC
jgi:hypothetical protein